MVQYTVTTGKIYRQIVHIPTCKSKLENYAQHRFSHDAAHILTLDLIFRVLGVVDCTVYVAK